MLEDRCLEEEDFLALLAGDQSPEAWREHMRGCEECRMLVASQEPVRLALNEPAPQPIDALVKTARAHLEEALRLGPKPTAYYDAWPDTFVGPSSWRRRSAGCAPSPSAARWTISCGAWSGAASSQRPAPSRSKRQYGSYGSTSPGGGAAST